MKLEEWAGYSLKTYTQQEVITYAKKGQCKGKRRFDTPRHAKDALKTLLVSNSHAELAGELHGRAFELDPDSDFLVVYRCPWCTGWHLGHERPGR